MEVHEIDTARVMQGILELQRRHTQRAENIVPLSATSS
jgi:hypothetical protein